MTIHSIHKKDAVGSLFSFVGPRLFNRKNHHFLSHTEFGSS